MDRPHHHHHHHHKQGPIPSPDPSAHAGLDARQPEGEEGEQGPALPPKSPRMIYRPLPSLGAILPTSTKTTAHDGGGAIRLSTGQEGKEQGKGNGEEGLYPTPHNPVEGIRDHQARIHDGPPPRHQERSSTLQSSPTRQHFGYDHHHHPHRDQHHHQDHHHYQTHQPQQHQPSAPNHTRPPPLTFNPLSHGLPQGPTSALPLGIRSTNTPPPPFGAGAGAGEGKSALLARIKQSIFTREPLARTWARKSFVDELESVAPGSPTRSTGMDVEQGHRAGMEARGGVHEQ
jgi:hypothetical protein